MKIPSFTEYLIDKGVDVVGGRIKIEDAHKINGLRFDYETLAAKMRGLPRDLKPWKDNVLGVSFDYMERDSQDPEPFGCEMISSWKHHELDQWGAVIKGKVQDIWNWAIEESGLDPSEIEEQIMDEIDTIQFHAELDAEK